MKNNRRAWHLWFVALFMMFIYSMGIYDFYMMLSHSQNYYISHGYGDEVVKYFTDYPFYFMIFWIVNLLTGFMTSLFLIFRNKYSEHLALISVVADVILLVLTFMFRNRLNILGINTAIFDLFILLITFALYIYCKQTFKSKNNI